MNSNQDHELYEWIDRSADGVLEAEHRTALDAALESRPALRQEAEQMIALNAMLTADRIAVRPGFARAVVTALPPAAWERRHAWKLPLALAAGFGLAAVAMLALAASGGGEVAGGAFGTLAAIADFFQVTLLAGAGLLGATWSGVTLAVDELFAGDRSAVVALVLGVVFLDVIFLRMLRRSPRASAAASTERGDADDDRAGS